MNYLIFNCGSSSQSFTVFKTTASKEPEVISSGKARNVATKTQASSLLEWNINGESGSFSAEFPSHHSAAESILAFLKSHAVAIDAIGHRFVNGGTFFDRAVRLDNESLAKLQQCLRLAPIHNPNSWSVIEVCREKLPEVPQYAVFDTAFHASIPSENRLYGLPYQDAEKKGFKKIGFHGLSYRYISERAAQLLGKPLSEVRLIMCHLGTGGSSVCAFRDGHSVDSSMGYSPLSGLIMSTRCGDLDAEIVLDLIREGHSPEEVSDYLNKKSGLIGLSGYSSNLGEIIEAAEQGDKNCELAFRTYVHRLRGYIGAFLYELNGADALIFTDDAGVKYKKMREAVCADTEFMGIHLDPAKNNACDKISETRISADDSRMQIWVIPTNEERTIFNEIRSLECEA